MDALLDRLNTLGMQVGIQDLNNQFSLEAANRLRLELSSDD